MTDSPVSFFRNLTTSDCNAEPASDGSGEGEVPDGLVVLGTLLVILASFVSCIGVNFQKLAHNKNEMRQRAGRPGQRMTKMWRWWLGIGSMIGGSLMDLAALPFVPLSRVAALGASGIVANVIITPVMLKEKLTRHDLAGCFITVLGTATACYFGATGERKVDSHCLLLYFTEHAFAGFGTLLVAMLLTLYYFIAGFRRMELHARECGFIGGGRQQTMPAEGQQQSAQNSRPCCLETTWLHEHLGEFRAKVPPLPGWVFVTRFGPQFYPAVHAVFAGAIGAQSVMFSKAVLIFLGNAFRGEDTGKSMGLFLLFVIPTAFCLYHQIGQLNRALKIYADAVFVMPVYQAVWICVGIASGLIFYQEYRHVSSRRAGFFAFGIIVSLIGLFVLTNRKSRGKRGQPHVRLSENGVADAQRVKDGAMLTPVATPIYNGFEPQAMPQSASPPPHRQTTASSIEDDAMELGPLEDTDCILWLGSAAASALFQSQQIAPSTPTHSAASETPARSRLGEALARRFNTPGGAQTPTACARDTPGAVSPAARSPSQRSQTPRSTPMREFRITSEHEVDV
eukprot:Hpha_TRINITY_DN466_c0_g1::TRINITY_DN466_c0_g1_i1::g.27722::m.27722